MTDSESEEGSSDEEDSQNNNASRLDYENMSGGSTRVLIRSPEEIQKQEEAEMMKFVDFMKKQGLVMVQQESPVNKTNKTTDEQAGKRRMEAAHTAGNSGQGQKGNRGIVTDFIDNVSVVMVYKNAVESDKGKCDSLSSDEPLDTSDEIDKTIPLGGLELNNTTQNINDFISDVRWQTAVEPDDGMRMSVVDRGRIIVGEDLQPQTS